MSISIIDGFKVTSALPADLKSIWTTTHSLYSTGILNSTGYISSSWRYLGMKVFCQDSNSEYQLLGGVADSNWVQLTTGNNYISSSYALTSSYVSGSNVGTVLSSSYAITSSYSPFPFGSYVTTSSFNNYTSSNNSVVYALVNATSSYVNTSSFNNYTASNNSLVYGLLLATSSYITNAQTSSMSVLKSVSASYLSGSNAIVNNLTVTGVLNATQISGSQVYITSSQLTATDNILILNAQTPHLRYAGIEVYDSGSTNNLAAFLWDGTNNYFILSSSDAGYSRRIVTGPDGEGLLTVGYIPVATGSNGLINSIISQSNNIIYITGNVIANSFTGSFNGTSSTSLTAISASYISSSNIVGTVLSSSYAYTSSYLPSGIYLITSSWSLNSATASYISASNIPSFTASYANNSISSSYAVSSSTTDQAQTSSLALYSITSSYLTGSGISDTFFVEKSLIMGNTPSAATIVPTSYNGITITSDHSSGYDFGGMMPSILFVDSGSKYPMVAIGYDPFSNSSNAGQFALIGSASMPYGNICGFHTNNLAYTVGDDRMFVMRIKDPGAGLPNSNSGSYTLFENRYKKYSPDADTTYANFLLCDEYGNVGIGDMGYMSDNVGTGLHPTAKVVVYGSPNGNYPAFQVAPFGYNNVGSWFTVNANGSVNISGSLSIGTSYPPVNTLDVRGNIHAIVVTASLFGTASYATYATSASYAPIQISSSYSTTSSYAVSSSTSKNATSASYAPNVSASYASTASYGISSSWAGYSLATISSSYSSTSSYSLSASYAPISVSSSYAITSSYALNVIPIIITGSTYPITSSVSIQSISASYLSGSVGIVNSLTASNIIVSNNINVGGYIVNSGIAPTNSNIIGIGAGLNATYAYQSNFFGVNTGYQATYAAGSNFFGNSAGQGATFSDESNFIGAYAGWSASLADQSNFFGLNAGYQSISASNSNFIGTNAGYQAASANNSIFIGYQSGYTDTVNNFGNHSSILIGDYTSTNGFSDSIAIGRGTANSAPNQFNLGGLLWGNGISHGAESPSSASVVGGKIGIGLNNPVNALDVIGNISASIITASLFFGTASWSQNAISASYVLGASNISSSYSLTSSYALNGGGGNSITSSYAYTSSWALNGFMTPIFYDSDNGQYYGLTVQGASGSEVIQINPVTYNSQSGIFSNVSSSYSLTSSYALNGGSGGGGLSGGSTNYIPIWSSPTSLSSSNIYQSGSNIGVSTTNPLYTLQVSGTIAPVGDAKTPLGNPSNRFSDLFALQTTVGAFFEVGLRTEGIGVNPTGTIVIWRNGKLVPSDIEEDEMIMGVIKEGKDEPIILGAEVILVTGKVEEGDYIVTSNKIGHGKAVKRGSIFKKDLFGKVIAQALESSNSESNLIKSMIRKF